jgi:hypothetical protein
MVDPAQGMDRIRRSARLSGDQFRKSATAGQNHVITTPRRPAGGYKGQRVAAGEGTV